MGNIWKAKYTEEDEEKNIRGSIAVLLWVLGISVHSHMHVGALARMCMCTHMHKCACANLSIYKSHIHWCRIICNWQFVLAWSFFNTQRKCHKCRFVFQQAKENEPPLLHHSFKKAIITGRQSEKQQKAAKSSKKQQKAQLVCCNNKPVFVFTRSGTHFQTRTIF